MAIANSDGSIILPVQVDTTGVDGGINEIKRRAKSLDTTFTKTGQIISDALGSGDTKVAGLAINYKKATEEAEKQAQVVEVLRQKLSSLSNGGEIKDKGAEKLSSDLEKMMQKMKDTKSELETLKAKMAEIKNSGIAVKGNTFFAESSQAEYEALRQKYIDLANVQNQNVQKATEMKRALSEAMGASRQAEITQTEGKLAEAERKMSTLLEKAQLAVEKVKKAMSEGGSSTDGLKSRLESVGSGFGKLGTRIAGLAKRVFVFSVITSALRSVRTAVSNVLMSNSQFSNSLNQLKSSLWTAFAPIYNVVVPALTTLINWLNTAVNVIVKFFAAIARKSYSSLVENGQALKKQAENYKKVGKSSSAAASGMKKATKEAEKQLAAFDDLQILSDTSSNDTGSGGSGGGSGDAGTSVSDGAANSELSDDFKKGIMQFLSGIMLSLGVALAAVGIVMIYTGNIPMGIGLIMAGVTAGELGVIMQPSESGDIDASIAQTLNTIKAHIGELIFVIGVILLLCGQIPLGVGAMIAGATLFNIQNTEGDFNALSIKEKLAVVAQAIGAALFVLGVIVLMLGHVPLGVGLMAGGAALFGISTATLNESGVTSGINKFFKENAALIVGVAVALVIIGIILLFTGVGIPLAIGLIVAGGGMLATEAILNWNAIKEKITSFIADNSGLIVGVSAALIVLGIILLFTGVGIPLAIGLIVAGGGMLAAEVAVNWNFIVDKVKSVWQSIKDFWNNHIKQIFTKEWWISLAKKCGNGLLEGFTNAVNAVIGLFEKMINFIVKGLNKISFDVPDWVPGVGGKKFGFDLSEVNLGRLHVPKLAQGAVIPANREFLAVLGDQKRGTNIEAPAELIKQMAKEAYQEMGLANVQQQQIIKEEHYNLNQTELMSIIYKLVKGGERLSGSSLVKQGGE